MATPEQRTPAPNAPNVLQAHKPYALVLTPRNVQCPSQTTIAGPLRTWAAYPHFCQSICTIARSVLANNARGRATSCLPHTTRIAPSVRDRSNRQARNLPYTHDARAKREREMT